MKERKEERKEKKGKKEEKKRGKKKGETRASFDSFGSSSFPAPLQVINSTLTQFLSMDLRIKGFGEEWTNPRNYFG